MAAFKKIETERVPNRKTKAEMDPIRQHAAAQRPGTANPSAEGSSEQRRPRNVIKTIIDPKHQGKRLRDFLKNELKMSGRNIKRLAMDRQIYVGRKSVHLDYRIRGGETLILNLDREEHQDMAPVAMDLAIVYEDSSLVVVDKPPFLVVHPTKNHKEDTLTNGLLWHFREHGDPAIVRLVSRLDMNTSGLVLVAKNQFIHSAFARYRGNDKPVKTYLAITQGIWREKRGTIDAPIHWPNPEDYRRTVHELGQASITHYEVLDEFSGYSLVRFVLGTGRTHQIRVHSAHLGHPLVGDSLYGGLLQGENPRQLLHAWQLAFIHPMSREQISLKAELPEDMKEFIRANGGTIIP